MKNTFARAILPCTMTFKNLCLKVVAGDIREIRTRVNRLHSVTMTKITLRPAQCRKENHA